MKRRLNLLFLLLVLAPLPLIAEEVMDEEEAIKAAALDYIEGFYEANPERVKRGVHPLLAKRGIMKYGDVEVLEVMTSEQLAAAAMLYYANRNPGPDALRTVTILDRLDQTASVKVTSEEWVDYMHLAKMNGRWVIVNVLWQNRPIEVVQAEGMPPAGEVIEMYLSATGGRDAYQRIRNRLTKGKVVIAGQEFEASFERRGSSPNLQHQFVEVEGFGRIERGTDGKHVWRIHPLEGARLLEGSERAFVIRHARFNMELNWRELYEKAACVGAVEVEGRSCYKLAMAPSGGEPEYWYIDRPDGLMRKMEMSFKTEEGDIVRMTEYPEDYREVDGILFPFRVRSREGGEELLITYESVEHNVKMDAKRFEPPEEVKELLDG